MRGGKRENSGRKRWSTELGEKYNKATFEIELALLEKLRQLPNQTEVVNVALRQYFDNLATKTDIS